MRDELRARVKRPGASSNERTKVFNFPLLSEARLGLKDLFTTNVPLSLFVECVICSPASLQQNMSFVPHLKYSFGTRMVSLLKQRRRDSGTDKGRYKVFSKWAVILFLYTLPLINCLLGLCGYHYYWFVCCPLRNIEIEADAFRRSLLFSSIPVKWWQQVHDYVPEF